MRKMYTVAPLLVFAVSIGSFASDHKKATPTLSQFTENVLTHVLLHELGHAFFKEFQIPVLANEEDMADSFATTYITQHMPDQAVAIVTARAQSWMIEDTEVSPEHYDHQGEHPLDIRRAYRAMCRLYGNDPTNWGWTVEWVGFSEGDLNDCSDLAANQRRSWQRVLTPLRMAEDQRSENVVTLYGEGPYKQTMIENGLVERIADIARQYDWPEKIYIHFDHCDWGAQWSRSRRTVTLCDDYVVRFMEQDIRRQAFNWPNYDYPEAL